MREGREERDKGWVGVDVGVKRYEIRGRNGLIRSTN